MTSKPNTEVPDELTIEVSDRWLNIIRACQDSLNEGTFKVKLAGNAEPIKFYEIKPSFPCHKEISFFNPNPTDLADVRASKNWIRAINICRTYVPSGTANIMIRDSQPVKVFNIKPGINPSKKESFPDVFIEGTED